MPIGQFREEWRIRRGISQLSVGGGVARQSYLQKILEMFGTSLIGYWPGSEEAGTVAVDYSGNGYNGVYTGVTLGQEGVGDGNTCPLYDGANDYMQPPAGFRTAFTPTAYSILVHGKVNSAAIWTDGLQHNLFRFAVDANNNIRIIKTATNNQLSFASTHGGTASEVTFTTSAPVIFFHVALTVDISADQLKAYFNGAQVGITQTGLGTWSGTLAASTTVIGAATSTPTTPWNGYIAHVPVLSRAATASEMAQAATI